MASALDGLTDAQRAAVTHRGSPLLVIGGPGTGKTEVLVAPPRARSPTRASHAPPDPRAERARRACASASSSRSTAPTRSSRSTPPRASARDAARRRGRRTPASTPSSTSLSAADRLAMLLERADELELAHHDFRGRPLALFASFVRRIDALSAELDRRRRASRAWAAARRRRRRASASASSRPSSPPTTACSTQRGVFDEGGVLAAAVALLRGDGAVRARVAARYPAVLVDDWQDRSRRRARARRGARGRRRRADRGRRRRPGASRARAAPAPPNLLRFAQRAPGRDGRHARRELPLPAARARRRPRRRRPARRRASARTCAAAPGGEVRFWRAANERAQAQQRRGRARAADRPRGRRARALRGARAVGSPRRARRSPSRSPSARSPAASLGAEAFFERTEVRDVLAWLRLLVDPRDAPAVVRALARPPIELPSRRHRALRADRAAAAHRHGRGARRRDRVAAARARGARADLAVPAHPPRRRARRSTDTPRRPLRAPPDRARSACAATSSSPPAPTSSSGSSTSPSSASSRARFEPPRAGRQRARVRALRRGAGRRRPRRGGGARAGPRAARSR